MLYYNILNLNINKILNKKVGDIIKALNKKQHKLKQIRDSKRQEYHEYLESKGKPVKKNNNSTKQGQTGSSGSNFGFSSAINTNGNYGGNSSVTVNAYFNNAIYLKPTQIGFDGFFAIGRYPQADFSGVNEIYSNITYIEVRYSTSYVYNQTSFDNAWDSSTSVYLQGAISNWTNGYSIGDYIHVTPTLTSGYNYQQLVKVDFANNLNNDSSSWKSSWTAWTGDIDLTVLSSPSISFDQSTNLFHITGGASGTYRAIEFNRNAYTPYSSFLTGEETDICYNCCVRNQEYGLYEGQVQQAFDFALWDVGTYTVRLEYATSHPSGTRTRFSNAVNNWISEMNSAISGSGISFVRDDLDMSPDILIETKSNVDMGSTSDYTYGGLWENYTDADGWIYYAYIKLNYETEYYDTLWTSVEAITTEELTQACGCGGDLTTSADCLNTDFNWYGKSDGNFNTIDSHIQNFLYNSDIYIAVGTDSEDLAVLMNPSNGFTSTNGTSKIAYWMLDNVTYNMRVWQANSSNHYSVVPSYTQTFTPTSVRPSNWSWTTTIVSGGDVYSVVNKTIYILTSSEWNNFTSRINEFRGYKRLEPYSFTTVSTNTEFTKTIINQALNALRDLSSYFTGGNTIPSNRVTGDNILVASYFTNMRDAMNSIV